jgi:hypothetical protein
MDQNPHALVQSFVTAIKREPRRLGHGCRAKEVRILAAQDRIGRIASSAQDALSRIIEQRASLLPNVVLDMDQSVEHPVVGLSLYSATLKVWLLVGIGIDAPHLQCYLHSATPSCSQ